MVAGGTRASAVATSVARSQCCAMASSGAAAAFEASWIARLYRCDTPAKLHEELGRAPEMVAGAGTVRLGQLVLSNLLLFGARTSVCQTCVAPGGSVVSAFARAARFPTCRLVRRDGPHGPPVSYDDEPQREPSPKNPNGNATSFIKMDEVFSCDGPRHKGQPPEAALQLDSELESTARRARPSGTE